MLIVVDSPMTEVAYPTKADTKPLPPEFGRNLDTLAKARQWLTNPHNWHKSDMWILKWDGLLVTINERHAQNLIVNPSDNGLPECVLIEQYRLRQGGKRFEEPTAEEQ